MVEAWELTPAAVEGAEPLVHGANKRQLRMSQTMRVVIVGRRPSAAKITPVIADGTGFTALHPELSTFWKKSHISL